MLLWGKKSILYHLRTNWYLCEGITIESLVGEAIMVLIRLKVLKLKHIPKHVGVSEPGLSCPT